VTAGLTIGAGATVLALIVTLITIRVRREISPTALWPSRRARPPSPQPAAPATQPPCAGWGLGVDRGRLDRVGGAGTYGPPGMGNPPLGTTLNHGE